MTGTEIKLEDMLQCREERANMQAELLEEFHNTLISYCMNIPGPIKTNEMIRGVFEQGKKELLAKLPVSPLKEIEIHKPTGDELMLVIPMPAEEVKTLTVKIEEEHPLGRLFDLDVIADNGRKISRKNYRKCLICGKQVQECARSRAHSVEEMQSAIEKLIKSAKSTATSSIIG